MKFCEIICAHFFASSLPVRGAWIEMLCNCDTSAICRWSLPVRGAWIEIISALHPTLSGLRRSPCGERGLKCQVILM